MSARNGTTSRLLTAQRAEEIETVETGTVTVTEIEAQGIVADALPTYDLDSGEFLRAIATVLIAQDVALSEVGRAGGGRPKGFEFMVRLDPVVPYNRHFATDELDVNR